MEAKDLRIGNYVRLNDCVCVVNSLHEYGTARLTPLDPSINWKWESFNLKQTPETNAILLTEEILLKCGFKKTNKSWLFDSEIGKYHINSKNFISGFGGKLINCKYLHELQNLYFTLTGNELQING